MSITVTGRRLSQAFDDCMKVLLVHEGGYVNDPQDPGGRTNLGVTQRVWEAWVGRPATEADMRGLTPAKVAPLYRAHYWNAVLADYLPDPLGMCVFDFAVNAGVGRAGRYLQDMVGAAADGHVGPATIKAVDAFVAAHGVAEAVRRYQQARRSYYRALPKFPRYGKDWLRRVDEVETAALRLAS